MTTKRDFSHLHFERRLPRLNARLQAFLIAGGINLLLWWILPASAYLVLLFLAVPALVWVASYGWRSALEKLIRYLERLQLY